MSFKKFFFFLILQWLVLAFTKWWFFNSVIFSNSGLQEVVYCAAACVFGAALIRRFGVINFFEAIFAASVWTVWNLILDFLLLAIYTTTAMFHEPAYWFGCLFLF